MMPLEPISCPPPNPLHLHRETLAAPLPSGDSRRCQLPSLQFLIATCFRCCLHRTIEGKMMRTKNPVIRDAAKAS
ncbi:hypothetical protein L6164_033727 [Bauhinia variegata]|uniref:Uncharacterized protein n=1 Tax=Bauhinia variegata TaxID=167791 RepID=A0ACB9KSS7_BAUVA|nr:hypothetical protein L6164_033727 [Bauhinia variegata]